VVLFTRLVIIATLLDSLSNALITTALATGRIKNYQMVVGGVLLLNLPISFSFLRLGFQPQITMYIAIAISAICLLLRLWMLKSMVGLSIKDYIQKVLLVIIIVSIASYVIPLFLVFHLNESFIHFIIVGAVGLICSITSIYSMGLSVNEKRFFIQIVKNRIKNITIYRK
jgi:hypothetical protein